ncbi:hypothetical protein I4F81_012789 [Pyropia yezoensis]|uniref:Uncharacterized protein n=1 Tax=Pyropia yezoensis TaxID=2788 RepID=A0ACC3CK75_PYRYE|nr:hypothetical protein I4F81_012789 [Neopyropia yezoensis]
MLVPMLESLVLCAQGAGNALSSLLHKGGGLEHLLHLDDALSGGGPPLPLPPPPAVAAAAAAKGVQGGGLPLLLLLLTVAVPLLSVEGGGHVAGGGHLGGDGGGPQLVGERRLDGGDGANGGVGRGRRRVGGRRGGHRDGRREATAATVARTRAMAASGVGSAASRRDGGGVVPEEGLGARVNKVAVGGAFAGATGTAAPGEQQGCGRPPPPSPPPRIYAALPYDGGAPRRLSPGGTRGAGQPPRRCRPLVWRVPRGPLRSRPGSRCPPRAARMARRAEGGGGGVAVPRWPSRWVPAAAPPPPPAVAHPRRDAPQPGVGRYGR